MVPAPDPWVSCPTPTRAASQSANPQAHHHLGPICAYVSTHAIPPNWTSTRRQIRREIRAGKSKAACRAIRGARDFRTSAPAVTARAERMAILVRVSLAAESTADMRLFGVGFLQAELLDAIANLIAMQTEERGRPRLVAAGAFERLHHQALLHFLEVHAFGRQLEPAVARGRPCDARCAGCRSRPAAAVRFRTSSTARSTRFRSSRTLPGQP